MHEQDCQLGSGAVGHSTEIDCAYREFESVVGGHRGRVVVVDGGEIHVGVRVAPADDPIARDVAGGTESGDPTEPGHAGQPGQPADPFRILHYRNPNRSAAAPTYARTARAPIPDTIS